jgi:uncharacterized protein (DUF362 family)
MSAGASVTAFRKARFFRDHARMTMAGLCLVAAIVAGMVFVTTQPAEDVFGQAAVASQTHFTPTEAVNSPIGVPFGIKPGRVAWAFDPKATTWDGTTNAPGWWDDKNTHPEVVSAMFSEIIRSVGDAPTDKEAWNKIFTDFNQRKGKGAVGYQKGQKVVLKLNLNQCRAYDECENCSYIAPQLEQVMLRELVNDVGVAPADITIYDAIRQVPSTIFDLGKQFPGVHFVDSLGTNGREKAVADNTKPLILTQSGTTFYFPTCVTQADYMINVAGLKGHTLAGMTVTAKNHLGSLLNAQSGSAAQTIHSYIAVRGGGGGGRGGRGGPGTAPAAAPRAGIAGSDVLAAAPSGPAPAGGPPAGGAARGGGTTPQGMGAYNGLVDLNGHDQIGGKTILYIIDALYATQTNETKLSPVCKWQSAPFNGNWTASLFASQDQVAIDSVGLDFLRNEPSINNIVTGAVDNYLHEMAQANQAPSKTAYDPAKDGKMLKSMGVHEHWNNAADKKYSRNLGTGAGIELVNVSARPVS